MRALRTVVSLAVFAALAATASGGTIFVDDNAVGAANGTNWTDAYPLLQDALTAAQPGDDIWVAEGVYRPDQGGGQTPGDRFATFSMKSGVRLFGGFAGGEATLSQRAGLFETTILSGDLNGDDSGVGMNDNSLHVARADLVDNTAVLDGFMVTAGNATVSLQDDGAGMYITNASPLVRDCRFENNHCTDDGAAVTSINSSLPVFVRCSFVANVATDVGGAFWTHAQSLPSFINCAFIGNRSGDLGGALYQFQNTNQPMPLIGCLFSGNFAANNGGAMYVSSGITDCVGTTFANNRAGLQAGGIFAKSTTRVTGSIFWGNTDGSGGSQLAQVGGSTPAVFDYNCVQGLTGSLGGVGNIGADPKFFDDDGLDDIAGTIDDDLRLDHGSPCIDAGSNPAYPADAPDLDNDGNTTEPLPLDLSGGDRFFDDPGTIDTGLGAAPIVDMGCLEGPANTNVVPYGSGCPGSGGFTPTLTLTGLPNEGNQVVLTIDKGLGGAMSLLLFGTQPAAIPIAPGCTLNVTPLLPLQLFVPLGGAGPGTGIAILPAVIPAGSAGAVLTMQVFVAEPTQSVPFSNSKGLEISFQ